MPSIAAALVLLSLGTAPSPVVLRDELRPLRFLVGSCWTGTFPDGKSTDTHCFEPVFDGKFIRDRHVVRGGPQPYSGETLWAWDGRRKAIVYTYWASDGGMSTGAAAPDASGDLTFSEEYAGSDGAQVLRSVWSPRPDGTFEIRVSEKKDGSWHERWRMVMRRDAAAK